ncbi:MAG: amino acid permease [Treponema sp.]|jgi:amino acid transporter/cytidylate kinase|nr:amino acid permease [Treponema sp.]
MSSNVQAKKFKLLDAVLAAVCVILVVESAAPTAAIGNSQYFWWLLLLIAFFVPYGLVSAELGTTYAGKGGLFDWVRRAYGRAWGSRVAWYYWIQFVFWFASLAILFTEVIDQAFGTAIPAWGAVAIQLAFVWIMCFASLLPISKNKLLINLGTYAKVLLMLALGVFGLYLGIRNGFANPLASPRDLLPGVAGVSFIAVIIFNFKGFEVVTSFTGSMENPKKQIPQALLLGGILISFFYIFASFGIGAAIPMAELTTYGGFLDSFGTFFNALGLPGRILIPVVGILFLYTLFVNILSWALGVNYVASYAARAKALPHFFGKLGKGRSPLGASIANGVVASLLVIGAQFITNPDIFWAFFALQIITSILAYMIMFPAFKKLRNIDPNVDRPFKVPGGPVMINLIAYLPFVLLIAAAAFSMVYPLADGSWYFDSMLVFGTLAALFAGELIVFSTGPAAMRLKQSFANMRTVRRIDMDSIEVEAPAEAVIDPAKAGLSIVTVSREMAALGDETSREIAKVMNYRLIDKEALESRMYSLGIKVDSFKKYDERKPSFFAALSQDQEDYLHFLQGAIFAEAEQGHCVLVGRGANVILRGMPAVISVFLSARNEIRIERVKDYFRCDDKRAAQIIERSDRDRAGFYRSIFNIDWRHKGNYHLALNTGIFSPHRCARIIDSLTDDVFTPEAEEENRAVLGDMILAHKIKHSIMYEEDLPIRFLDVSSSNGTVTMRGAANSQALLDTALSLAREAANSADIRNEMQVIREYRAVP